MLVSAALSHHGVADRLLNAVDAGQLDLVVSAKLLYELESVIPAQDHPQAYAGRI